MHCTIIQNINCNLLAFSLNNKFHLSFYFSISLAAAAAANAAAVAALAIVVAVCDDVTLRCSTIRTQHSEKVHQNSVAATDIGLHLMKRKRPSRGWNCNGSLK